MGAADAFSGAQPRNAFCFSPSPTESFSVLEKSEVPVNSTPVDVAAKLRGMWA